MTKIGSYIKAASTSFPPTTPVLPLGIENLYPYVESLILTHNLSEVEQDITSTSHQGISEQDITSTSHQGISSVLTANEFLGKHSVLLNAIMRDYPWVLEKLFPLMLKVPVFIDFDIKLSYFRSKLRLLRDEGYHFTISVKRSHLLEDSHEQLARQPGPLNGKLHIVFQDELGVDAGGVRREWYELFSKAICDKNALLFTTVGSNATYQPNVNSKDQAKHDVYSYLSYFKVAGRVFGKALFDEELLDVHFTKTFYKHILGEKVTYKDFKDVDPDMFTSLNFILQTTDEVTFKAIHQSFSVDGDEEHEFLHGKREDTELIPGGRDIFVTNDNKQQYVDLVTEHKFTKPIAAQIESFVEGFRELIPQELISIFNDNELELLLSGLPDIDLADMRQNTEYHGYDSQSLQIQWFWEVADGFSKEDKAHLLQFISGTSKVPLGGFSSVETQGRARLFSIHKDFTTNLDSLPGSHTCTYQLDLPEYPSREILMEKLLLAIREGSEGFPLA